MFSLKAGVLGGAVAMVDARALSQLIGALYDAAAQPEEWEPLVARIAAFFGTSSCAIQTRDSIQGKVLVHGATANILPHLNTFASYYHPLDEWVKRGAARPINTAIGSDDIITDRELERLEFFDWLRLTDTQYVLGSVITLDGQNTIAAIGVHRDKKSGLFDAEAKQVMGLLLPHLRRALSLQERLRGLNIRSEIGFGALDRLGIATFVVATDGRVLHATACAERLLKAGFFSCRGGRLQLGDASAQSALLRALRNSTAAGRGVATARSGATVFARGPDGTFVSLFVSPLPRRFADVVCEPSGIVFTAMQGNVALSASVALGRLWGLTPAEARLAEALVAGERLQDYAERTGLSLHTVRTQLKAVFGKSGHSRQSDLIREVLGNPILKLAQPEATDRG